MDRIKRIIGFAMLVLPLVVIFLLTPWEGKATLVIGSVIVAWIIVAVNLVAG